MRASRLFLYISYETVFPLEIAPRPNKNRERQSKHTPLLLKNCLKRQKHISVLSFLWEAKKKKKSKARLFSQTCCCITCINFLHPPFWLKTQRNTDKNCTPGAICLSQAQVSAHTVDPTQPEEEDRLMRAGISSTVWSCSCLAQPRHHSCSLKGSRHNCCFSPGPSAELTD